MVTKLEGILKLISSHSSFPLLFFLGVETGNQRKETLWRGTHTTVKCFSSLFSPG